MQVILYTNESGGVSICTPTGELHINEVKAKDTPEHSIIVDSSILPEEHNIFFNAWELDGDTVIVNVNKAKDIAHDLRRLRRAEEFYPLDIKATIPSEAAAAEAARQEIRDRYAAMQVEIDAASTPEEIKIALG